MLAALKAAAAPDVAPLPAAVIAELMAATRLVVLSTPAKPTFTLMPLLSPNPGPRNVNSVPALVRLLLTSARMAETLVVELGPKS